MLPEAGPAADAGQEQAEPARVRRRMSWWGRLGLLVMVPALLYAIYLAADKSVEIYRLRYEAAVVRAEIEASRAQNLRLQRELVEARSDQQIEAIARRDLNLIRPGDQSVVIRGPLPTPSPTPLNIVRPKPGDDLPPWLLWVFTRLGL